METSSTLSVRVVSGLWPRGQPLWIAWRKGTPRIHPSSHNSQRQIAHREIFHWICDMERRPSHLPGLRRFAVSVIHPLDWQPEMESSETGRVRQIMWYAGMPKRLTIVWSGQGRLSYGMGTCVWEREGEKETTSYYNRSFRALTGGSEKGSVTVCVNMCVLSDRSRATVLFV